MNLGYLSSHLSSLSVSYSTFQTFSTPFSPAMSHAHTVCGCCTDNSVCLEHTPFRITAISLSLSLSLSLAALLIFCHLIGLYISSPWKTCRLGWPSSPKSLPFYYWLHRMSDVCLSVHFPSWITSLNTSNAFKKIFIYLTDQVVVVARGLFHCSSWTL